MSDDRQTEAEKALAEARAAEARVESTRKRIEPVLDRIASRIEENAITWAFKQTLSGRTA